MEQFSRDNGFLKMILLLSNHLEDKLFFDIFGVWRAAENEHLVWDRVTKENLQKTIMIFGTRGTCDKPANKKKPEGLE